MVSEGNVQLIRVCMYGFRQFAFKSLFMTDFLPFLGLKGEKFPPIKRGVNHDK